MLTGKAGQLWSAIEPILSGAGFELVDLDWAFSAQRPADAILRLFIDPLNHDLKTTIEDCEQVSHLVGLFLDESPLIDHHYTLEVSSPGMERRIRKEADFQRFKDREVVIDLNEKYEGRRRVRGRILGAGEGYATLRLDEGGEFTFPIPVIKRAHLVYDFDKLFQSSSKQEKPHRI